MKFYLELLLVSSISSILLAPPPEGEQAKKNPPMPYAGPIKAIPQFKSCETQLKEARKHYEYVTNKYNHLSHVYDELQVEYNTIADQSARDLYDIDLLKNEFYTLLGTLLKTDTNIQKLTPQQFIELMRTNIKALLNYMDIEYDTPSNTIILIRKKWATLKQRCLRLEKELAQYEAISKTE